MRARARRGGGRGGTGLVVMADVVAEGRLELTAGDGEQVVQALSAHGPYPTFREHGARGARTGVRSVLMPAEAMMASKAAVNLVSRSRRRRRSDGRGLPCRLRSCEPPGRPSDRRVRCNAEHMDDPAVQFDHEQHVITTEQHGVDGEKVSGQDAGRLGTEEIRPARALAAGGRRKPRAGAARRRRCLSRRICRAS